jgi:hypothetical protein
MFVIITPLFILYLHQRMTELEANRVLRKSLIKGLFYLFVCVFLVSSIGGLGYWLEVLGGSEDPTQIHAERSLSEKKTLKTHEKGIPFLPKKTDQPTKLSKEEINNLPDDQVARYFVYKPIEIIPEELPEFIPKDEIKEEPIEPNARNLPPEIPPIKDPVDDLTLPPLKNLPPKLPPIKDPVDDLIIPPLKKESPPLKKESPQIDLFSGPIAKVDPISLPFITKPRAKQPCGIGNAGNYCFFNSLLQMLASVFEYFDVNDELADPEHIEPFRLLVLLLERVSSGGPTFYSSYAAKFLYNYGGKTWPWDIFDGRQQDAEEALGILINFTNRKRGPNNSYLSNENFAQAYELKFEQTNESDCQFKESPHRIHFLKDLTDYSLKLDFPAVRPGQVFYLEELVKRYFEPSITDYKCEAHNFPNKLTQQFTWKKFPKVLIMILKRFAGRQAITKLMNRVIIPEDFEYADNETLLLHKYKLRAFNIHVGSYPGSGHYYAYVRYGDNWFKCNDSYVEPARDLTRVLEGFTSGFKETPYLLMYVKEEPSEPFVPPYKEKELKAIPDDGKDKKSNLYEDLFGSKHLYGSNYSSLSSKKTPKRKGNSKKKRPYVPKGDDDLPVD